MAEYKKSTTVEHSLTVNGAELLCFLEGHFMDSAGEIVEVPDDIEDLIHVIIPGGGDYSGMSIPIKDMQFNIQWNEEDEE